MQTDWANGLVLALLDGIYYICETGTYTKIFEEIKILCLHNLGLQKCSWLILWAFGVQIYILRDCRSAPVNIIVSVTCGYSHLHRLRLCKISNGMLGLPHSHVAACALWNRHWTFGSTQDVLLAALCQELPKLYLQRQQGLCFRLLQGSFFWNEQLPFGRFTWLLEVPKLAGKSWTSKAINSVIMVSWSVMTDFKI